MLGAGPLFREGQHSGVAHSRARRPARRGARHAGAAAEELRAHGAAGPVPAVRALAHHVKKPPPLARGEGVVGWLRPQLLTVTVTPADVVEWPAASRATAVSV